MKRFDKRLKKQLRQEAPKISAQADTAFDEAINKIRAENLKRKPQWLPICAAVSMAVLVLLLLNFKTGYLDDGGNSAAESDICSAESAEGNKIIADKPQIEEMESIRVGMIDYRNPEIRQYIDIILTQFKKEIKDSQKSSVINYEVTANTERWFVLCLTVQGEEEDMVYYYYNVDKRSGCIVQMSDLFVGGFDYVRVFSEEIKKEIERGGDKEYWADSDAKQGVYKIDKEQEFYFNQKENLVIVFGKGEIAPEEMGYLKFGIEKEVFEERLR